ncbi:stage II sporulation protein M [Fictibacillus terranigra]|uniref:Stage II sporulation protein M n=1 Tax=Fictibacillus terranigra TaxID=3058424 RepID=A0ABT8E9P2_9BACL|nr:stage II sporulation protein M [Fictibacillus sp. CENA-BCM004]MDN4074641.1 stage II sporulation protein M [Fictibacillus sp. CENA-BCM004]
MRSMKRFVLFHLQEHYSLYVFVSVLLLMGVIFGAVIVNSLTLVQKQDLLNYLSRFFGEVSNGSFADPKDMFSQSYSHYIKYILVMWILGLSVIGLPVILVMLFIKGVVIGFTVGFLVNQMGWHGFLLAFVSVLPQNLILVPGLIVAAAASILFSIKMIRQQFWKKSSEPFFPKFFKYSALIITVGLFLAVASAFEAYLSPWLMEGVMSLKSSK